MSHNLYIADIYTYCIYTEKGCQITATRVERNFPVILTAKNLELPSKIKEKKINQFNCKIVKAGRKIVKSECLILGPPKFSSNLKYIYVE